MESTGRETKKNETLGLCTTRRRIYRGTKQREEQSRAMRGRRNMRAVPAGGRVRARTASDHALTCGHAQYLPPSRPESDGSGWRHRRTALKHGALSMHAGRTQQRARAGAVTPRSLLHVHPCELAVARWSSPRDGRDRPIPAAEQCARR